MYTSYTSVQQKPSKCPSMPNLVTHMHAKSTIPLWYVHYPGEVSKEKMKYFKGQEPPECKIENPHYARGNMKPREPTNIYSGLIQVGGRKSCDQLDTEVGNNMYAEINKD